MSPLSGKRVAISGLAPGAAARIVAALDAADAFCRRVAELDAAPGTTALNNYDLVVASPDVAAPWFDRSRRRMERSLLVSGSAEALQPHLVGLAGRDVDFMLIFYS